MERDVGRSRATRAPAASAGSRRSPGSCSSVAATPLAAGPLSRTRSAVAGGRYGPSTASGKSPMICVGGVARGQSAAEERVQRLEARRAVARGRGRPQREEPGAHLHRPAHRLRLAVGHHERRGDAPRRCAMLFASSASGASSTSRFRRTTRVVARAAAARVRAVATTSTRSPSESVPASSWLRLAEDGDRALLARELGEDAALRERRELAERDLLALVDRVGDDLRGQRRRARRPSRRRRARVGPISRLQVAAAGDGRALGAGRDVARGDEDLHQAGALVDVVPVADDVDADEHGREHGERHRQRSGFEFWAWSRSVPFAFYLVSVMTCTPKSLSGIGDRVAGGEVGRDEGHEVAGEHVVVAGPT